MKQWIRVVMAFLVLSISTLSVYAQSGMITTAAGDGTEDFGGDGGPATSAQLYNPYGVAVDLAGNVYIADTHNNRVRKVTPAGVISTVAGDGTYGFDGDGGLATAAQLDHPMAVAVDKDGNLYIADYYNSAIRKVTPGGVISTVVGDFMPGFIGDGGPATSAELHFPSGLAVDQSGNLYIADQFNAVIRKVAPNGVISTVAGVAIAGVGIAGYDGDGGPATSAHLDHPYGIALDAAGNLYIADYFNSVIRKVTNGIISTVAGHGVGGGFDGDGGPATSATLNFPWGVAVDAAGTIYIADTGNSRVRKVSGGVINTVAGNDGFLYSGDGVPATSSSLSLPAAIALDAAGNLYIADLENARVRKVDFGFSAKILIGDFNGDGKTDILWQNTDGSTAIWLMNGLSVLNGGGLLGPGTGWSVAQLGDFNGDGKTDILWQNTDGSTAIWLMNGLSVLNGGGLLGPGTGWSMAQLGDFNGDGKTDILWQNTDGSTAIWLMNGLNVLNMGGLLGPGTGWSVAQVGNFNGDTNSDILWQHTDGSTAAWLMNGLSVLSGQNLLGPGTGWSVLHVGDFDGDGKTDILWQNADGSTAIWLMNGLSVIGGETLLGPDTGWSVVQVGDFNHDGKRDIVWQNADGSTAVWLMNGLSVIEGGTLLGPGTGWIVRQVADFDHDGNSDIVWWHADGSAAMWLMNGLVGPIGTGLLGPATGWTPAP